MDDAYIKSIVALLKDLSNDGFTGTLDLNFNCGGITNIKKIEHIKIKKEIPVLVVKI